jgi:hypothetical protein
MALDWEPLRRAASGKSLCIVFAAFENTDWNFMAGMAGVYHHAQLFVEIGSC